MHITIFEENDFCRWCESEVQDHKEAILKRACGLLLCSSLTRKSIKFFAEGEDILFNNLDLIEISYELADGESKLFNTCLADRCLTILYDDISLKDICDDLNISSKSIEIFFNKLSNFITDASIIEWKLSKGLSVASIKLENSKLKESCFFPVSYYLIDLIHTVESLTGKFVKFTPDDSYYASITKENIICYFSSDRLESEYIVAEQLIKVLLSIRGFREVDTHFFTNLDNWKYDEKTLEEAINVIIQNKYTTLTISELYPIYKNTMLYSLLNFRSSEDYMTAVCRYLCSYSKKHKLCSNCSGIDDIFNQEGLCPLYSDDSIMDRVFSLEEISTPDKQEAVAKEMIISFTSK